MIEISPSAIAEIKRLQSSRQIPNSCLRLSVKTGGCRGLVYDLKLEQLESTSETTAPQGDRSLEIAGVTLKIDPQSWEYSEHLKLDYSKDLMGGGFRFHNPRLKNSCGCGISFAIPEFSDSGDRLGNHN